MFRQCYNIKTIEEHNTQSTRSSNRKAGTFCMYKGDYKVGAVPCGLLCALRWLLRVGASLDRQVLQFIDGGYTRMKTKVSARGSIKCYVALPVPSIDGVWNR